MFYFWNSLTKHKAHINTKTHKHKRIISKKVVETYLRERCIQILSYNDNYNFLNVYCFRFVLHQNYQNHWKKKKHVKEENSRPKRKENWKRKEKKQGKRAKKKQMITKRGMKRRKKLKFRRGGMKTKSQKMSLNKSKTNRKKMKRMTEM